MKTKVFALLAVVAAGLAGAADKPADPAAKDVRAALDALNAAFEKEDADTIRRLMADDHLAVTPWGGQQSRAAQIKTLPELKLSAYEVGEMKVSMLGADAALFTYPLALKGTFRGKELPANNYASSVWHRRGGRWVEVFYQETPLAAK